MPVAATPPEERIWSKIGPVQPNGCWTWLGATHPAGYGLLGKSKGGIVRATHVMWKIHTGERVPKGMYICHTCDNPPCCNPQHLKLASPRWNSQDAIQKGRFKFPSNGFGDAHPSAKLTEGDMVNIKTTWELAPRRRLGRVQFRLDLAEIYRVSPGTIKAVVRGDARKKK